MAKSKVRGGKKAHKAKVDARNQKLKSAQSAMQKLLKEAMQKEIEALKDNNEGETVHDTDSTENTKQ
jgi:molybdenum-dependent DNA-binding transcriptional regulator ModE